MSPDGTAVVHDRLLHSLKVAQIARSLADRLQLQKNCPSIDPDVCYAAGLAHDLGHPPFGHAGEHELQLILDGKRAKNGTIDRSGEPIITDGFEGNAQTFRIVCKTSARKQEEWQARLGMRLTYRTLGAIAKYPWARGKHPAKKQYLKDKWSAYDSEKDQLDEALRAVEAKGLLFDGRSLEAQVMDYADDIAYAVGDIEDYYRVGVVDFRALRMNEDDPKRIESLGPALMKAEGHPRLDPGDIIGQFYGYALRRILEWARRLGDPEIGPPKSVMEMLEKAFNKLANEHPLPSGRYDGSSFGKLSIHAYASSTITSFLEAAEFDPEKGGLYVPAQTRIEIEVLKKLARFYTYDRPTIRMRQVGQASALRDCFFAFLESCGDYFFKANGRDTHFSIPGRLYEYCLLSMRERELSAHTTTARSAVVRAVVDYLCTLTDHSVLAIAVALREGTGDILGHLDSL
jgi:dGTPase